MADLSAGTLFSVAGMVFVITGAGSGIGAMMAKALAQNGAAKVYILGRRLEKLEETAQGHSNIVAVQCDVSSKKSLADAAARVTSEINFVNAVIANSGITGPTMQGLPDNATVDEFTEFLWNVPMEEFTNTFAVNTTAALYTCLAFLPLLDFGNKHGDSPGLKHKIRSQFITTTSIASFNRKATAGFSYGASKAAQTHLMKMLAYYLAPYMIRTNAIAPGLYASEMTASFFGDKDPTSEGFIAGDLVPLKRYGGEVDMAGAILHPDSLANFTMQYLCSRAGAYVDGNVLVTDGGRLSLMPATY